MTVVSDVEIRLRADIARLQQDLNGARREVTGAVNGMSASVEQLKSLLGGLATGAAVVGFAGIIKNSIDATDALNDMSVRTKVAIEDLAGLSYAAKLGDTSLEGVAGAISKLGMNIGKDGAKFRELGITATEPLEAFKQLADIFKNIEDPQQRAAFGAEALGKSWQEAAVLLDGGSEGISTLVERGKELSGITEQVAADAGAFNDKLDELGTAAQGAGVRVAAGLLPTLQKIADAFSTNAANSQELQVTVGGLSIALKGLATVGIGVFTLFQSLGKTIGGTAALAGTTLSGNLKLLTGDFKGAAEEYRNTGNIYKEMAADVYGDLDTAVKRIGDLWTDTGKAVTASATETKNAGDDIADALIAQVTAMKVATFLNAGEIEAARKKSAADAAAAAKKEESAYAGLIASIKEKMAADQLEIDGAAAITPVQQARIKLDQELAAGKITLTDKHRQEARALLDTAEALERNANAAKQTRAAVAALADERDKNYATLVAEADANEELVATYGKTKMEIAELTIARDEDRLSRRGELELSEDTVAQLEREIEARRRNVAAMRTIDDLDKRKAAQTEFWTSIDKTAHDTFISIANGGKDAATRLKDTFKNVFFDWLYQQTIKKWVINVQGQLATSATSGVVGAAASSLAGGGVAGSIGSAAGIAGVLGSVGGIATGALQTAGALLTGQIAVGQTLSAGLAALTSGSAAGAVAGLSSLAGALGPIALGIAGGVALLKKAFGSGPKEVTGTSLEGMLTPTGATGNTLSTWTKKGGWFSSGKSGTDSTAFTQAQVAAFTDTYKAILDVSKTMGAAVGVSTDALATRVQALRVDLTGLKTEAEQLGAVTKFFEGVADTVAAELVPNLSKFQKEGESLSATLQRVSTNYVTVDALFSALGKTVGATGAAGIAARESLIAAAGGLDTLASGISFFQQNMLTEAQRLAPVQKLVTEQLAAMGQSSLKTNEQFAAATLAIDTSTEAGAALFARMLALAPAFKQVADAAAAATAVEAERAEAIAAAAAAEKAAAEERAAAEKAAAEERAAQLAKDSRALDIQILELQGKSAEALAAVRADELASVDETLREKYKYIYALQDESKAAKAAADATKEAADAAKAAQEVRIGAVKSSYGVLKDAIAASGAVLGAEFKAQEAIIQSRKSAAEELARINEQELRDRLSARQEENSKLRSLADSLRSTLNSMAPAGATVAGRQAAQAQIARALAEARNGAIPAADSLRDALNAVAQPSTELFSSFEDYARDFYVTAGRIADLNDLTGTELSKSDEQIRLTEMAVALAQQEAAAGSLRYERELKLAQETYDTQVAANAAMLEAYERQYLVAVGEYTATLDLASAIRQFNASLLDLVGGTAMQAIQSGEYAQPTVQRAQQVSNADLALQFQSMRTTMTGLLESIDTSSATTAAALNNSVNGGQPLTIAMEN